MPKKDTVLAGAIDQARAALLDITRESSIGEHADFRMDGERLGTHFFESADPGYVGWHWVVTLTRAPRSKNVTVCEVDILPGDGALLAPDWVPWEDRLQPGDYGRSDMVPYNAHDERLDNVVEDVSDDPDLVDIPELGFGRVRVLSAEGISQAASRWYSSEQGPVNGRKVKDTCASCGFLVKMSGSLRAVFGVCANAWAQDDGRVVSLDHTCGAHSETDAPKQSSDWVVRPSRIDDFDVVVETRD